LKIISRSSSKQDSSGGLVLAQRKCENPQVTPAPPARDLGLLGAHGGAGVTTLARLTPAARDLGALAPGHGYLLRATPQLIVLVTRSTVPASARAAAAMRILAAQAVPVAVLAIVSDGLPEPPEAAYRFRVLAADVSSVLRIPFVPALRRAEDPADAGLTRRARRVIACIRPLAELSTDYPPPARTKETHARRPDGPRIA
jgi:hypothetical protein